MEWFPGWGGKPRGSPRGSLQSDREGALGVTCSWRAPRLSSCRPALARRAPWELRRSGGGELLAALRGTLVDAIDDREILPASTLDALCVTIAAGLKAARADLNDDVRAVYVATDGLCRQQPRCFDDSMNDDEDKEFGRGSGRRRLRRVL